MQSYREFLEEKLITFGGKAYPKFGQIIILAGGAGCYPKGTEFFTGSGWKNIEEYKEGDQVLQYDAETGSTSLTQPNEFVKLPVDQFYTIKNRRVDFTTSSNHRHLTINEKTGKHEVLRTHELVAQHNNKTRGNRRKLVTYFDYSGTGIDVTDDMIRLKVALYADGHVLGTKEPKFRVSLKKERKIERFIDLLERNDIEYRQYEERGYQRFEFKFDSKEKQFESYWYNCSARQLSIVCDEVIRWDGSTTKRGSRKDIVTFSSTSKQSTDFVQFAFSATGHDAKIYVDSRTERPDCYSVYVNDSSVGISKNPRSAATTEISEVESEDGLMYCFTVPTGFFVVRQNGKIYVSGNSGKGFVLSRLLGVEGKTLDVDALKAMAIKSTKFAAKVKEETGQDIKKFDLRQPENVSRIHEILADVYNLTKNNQKTLFSSVLMQPQDRKPNLIFDVTLKNMGKLESIARNAQDLGYDKSNIHIVWVVNDVKVALDQNAKRSRVVPEEVLMDTHEGAQFTMKKILDMGDKLKKYMDGEIVLAFNKVGVDSELVKSANGGSYVKKADYIRVKQKGRPQLSSDKLGTDVYQKIKSYVPDVQGF